VPVQATIQITPGVGQFLDAVSLVIGANTVVRETMVLADPSNAAFLATVNSAGALNVAETALDACIAANVLAVSLPAGQITTLTPPTAAAIGTAVSGDLLIGTQLAAASVPVALPTATITTLTPPTAAAIAAAIAANPPTVAVSGTVGVTQSTSPWIVAGGGTAGTAATGVLTVQGIAAMTPLLVTATFSAPQHIIVDSGTLTTVSTVTAVTSITNPVAVTGTFFQATQPVSIASGQVASGAFASGSIASGAIASGAIASGAIAAGAAAVGAFADGSVYVRSNAASTFPVTAIGTLTHNNAAPAGTNLGVLAGVASAAAPTYTTGDQVLLSTDLSGNLRTTGTFTGTITGAVTGTLTNNNAAPSTNNLGVLPAVANAANPSWVEGDQVLLSVDLAGRNRITGQGATGSPVSGNPVLVAASDGTNARMLSSDTSGHLIPAIVNANAADGISNTGNYISGNGAVAVNYLSWDFLFNGSTWDRARSAGVGNAVAATGIAAHAAYGEYLSTAPAPTTGQYSALQTDNAGSLFVKNTRRSQTAAQGTTITTSTAATAVTATPAANTFADLSQLIITVTPIAVTAIALTATLSDGTNTYIYDLDTGVIATGGGSSLVVNFNPPLPAASAATGWTVALSVNTVVAHITTVVVLQKAS
jgi:trimeric autotransporter adhesin